MIESVWIAFEAKEVSQDDAERTGQDIVDDEYHGVTVWEDNHPDDVFF